MKVFHPRGVIYVLVVLIGLLSAMPNMLPATALQRLPDWLASNQLSLGLDLQGGSHLLLGADTRPLIEKHCKILKRRSCMTFVTRAFAINLSQ